MGNERLRKLLFQQQQNGCSYWGCALWYYCFQLARIWLHSNRLLTRGQGGLARSNNDGTYSVITFPTSFQNTPKVAVTAPGVTGGVSNHVSVQTASVGNASFSILLSVGSSWVASNCMYIAIGTWLRAYCDIRTRVTRNNRSACYIVLHQLKLRSSIWISSSRSCCSTVWVESGNTYYNIVGIWKSYREWNNSTGCRCTTITRFSPLAPETSRGELMR